MNNVTNKTTQPDTIAGCKHIAAGIRGSVIFGRFYDQLLDSPENQNTFKASLGSKPRMPNPTIKPVATGVNIDKVAAAIDGLPLSWMEVERLDRWGVYHNIIALFGERTWVTVDRSGATYFYAFDISENFII